MLKFNRWYDGLKEPWRFITAAALIFPTIFLINSGGSLTVIGGIWAVALVIVRVQCLMQHL